jgi:hypothetical protein
MEVCEWRFSVCRTSNVRGNLVAVSSSSESNEPGKPTPPWLIAAAKWYLIVTCLLSAGLYFLLHDPEWRELAGAVVVVLSVPAMLAYMGFILLFGLCCACVVGARLWRGCATGSFAGKEDDCPPLLERRHWKWHLLLVLHASCAYALGSPKDPAAFAMMLFFPLSSAIFFVLIAVGLVLPIRILSSTAHTLTSITSQHPESNNSVSVVVAIGLIVCITFAPIAILGKFHRDEWAQPWVFSAISMAGYVAAFNPILDSKSWVTRSIAAALTTALCVWTFKALAFSTVFSIFGSFLWIDLFAERFRASQLKTIRRLFLIECLLSVCVAAALQYGIRHRPPNASDVRPPDPEVTPVER